MKAHHLIEKRFFKIIGMKQGDILSIVITPVKHDEITTAFRQIIGYSRMTKDTLQKMLRLK